MAKDSMFVRPAQMMTNEQKMRKSTSAPLTPSDCQNGKSSAGSSTDEAIGEFISEVADDEADTLWLSG